MTAGAQRDFEALVEGVVRHVLGPGHGAVDVGAHTGRHTRAMLDAVGPEGQVLAVEPLPGMAAALEVELGQHPGLRVVAGAVAPEPGPTEFVVATDRPEESSLRPRRAYSGPTDLHTVVVEAHRLDDLASGLRRVDLVKVDVEGAEVVVLDSGRRLLAEQRPVVVLEHGPGSQAFGTSSGDLFALLADAGYRLATVMGDPVVDAAALEAAARVGDVWDYVAVADDDAGAALVEALAEAASRAAPVDAAIVAAYRSVLRRDPDPGGLTTFRGIYLEHGIEVVEAILRDSDEARALDP